MDEIKMMPYRLPEDGIDGVKIRCRAAVARVEAQQASHRILMPRWAAATAFAVVTLIAVVIVGVMPGKEQGLMADYVAGLEQMPEDMLYEISIDAIEYSDYDDMNLLLN